MPMCAVAAPACWRWHWAAPYRARWRGRSPRQHHASGAGALRRGRAETVASRRPSCVVLEEGVRCNAWTQGSQAHCSARDEAVRGPTARRTGGSHGQRGLLPAPPAGGHRRVVHVPGVHALCGDGPSGAWWRCCGASHTVRGHLIRRCEGTLVQWGEGAPARSWARPRCRAHSPGDAGAARRPPGPLVAPAAPLAVGAGKRPGRRGAGPPRLCRPPGRCRAGPRPPAGCTAL